MIKLVLTDMDNTLVPFGAGHVSARARKAIAAVRAAGVQFGPATGRDYFELLRFFDGDDSCFRAGILSNGKKVMVDGDMRRVHLIDNAALQRFVDYVLTRDDCFVGAYPLKSAPQNPVWCMGIRQRFAELWGDDLSFEAHACDAVPDFEIIGATFGCAGTQADVEEVMAKGAELCPEFDFVQPVPHWVDILPSGVNKGSSLTDLMTELDVCADEIVFFGDAENDLAIMREVPNSVAVANATPEAAATARWHIGACADDAVAQALEEIARCAHSGQTPSFMR